MALTARTVASTPLLRRGLQLKIQWLLKKIAENPTPEGNSSARLDFDLAMEDLRWAWEYFRTDALAREICWRFPVAADAICGELTSASGKGPIPRTLLILMCERGIEAAQLLDDVQLRDSIQCALASRAGSLNLEMGDAARAAYLLEFASSVAQEAGSIRLLGRIISTRADVHLIRGEWETAKIAFQRSLEIARNNSDAPGAAVAMFGLGKSCRALEERLQAAEWFHHSLQQSRELLLRDLEGKVIQELGFLWMTLAEYGSAIRCFEDAVLIAVDPLARGQARLALAEALLASGAIERAGYLFKEAEVDARAAQDHVALHQILARRSELAKANNAEHTGT